MITHKDYGFGVVLDISMDADVKKDECIFLLKEEHEDYWEYSEKIIGASASLEKVVAHAEQLCEQAVEAIKNNRQSFDEDYDYVDYNTPMYHILAIKHL